MLNFKINSVKILCFETDRSDLKSANPDQSLIGIYTVWHASFGRIIVKIL